MNHVSYQVALPSRILFGNHSAQQLNPLLPPDCRRILLVTGAHLAAGDPHGIIRQLQTRSELEIVTGISPEPPLEEVDRIVQSGRRFHAQAVIAMGGGSVMDAAKAAAALIPCNGTTMDYFSGREAITGKGLFFAALPTSAGTGAEMTNNSVLTETSSHVKKSLRSPWMIADLAVVDPVLTLSCPPRVTAASGLDAFVQAVESFTSPRANTVSRALSAEAARKITGSLRTAYQHPENLSARAEMAEGSMLAGMAFAQTGLGAVHGLAHPIGSLRKVPHGMACAILMKPVFAWNAEICSDEYAELARICSFGDSAKDLIAGATALSGDLGVADRFSEFGLQESDFDFVVKNCRSASMSQNPRPMNDADVIAVLKHLI